MSTALTYDQVFLNDIYRSYLVVEQNGAAISADQIPIATVYNEQDAIYLPSVQVNTSNPAGIYSVDVPVIAGMNGGLWKVQWSYLLAGQQLQKNDYFYVNPAGVATDNEQYCSAQQIRDLSAGMGIEGITDAQLDNMAITASRLVDDYCKRTFGPTTEEEQRIGVMDIQGRYFFQMKKKPVVKVNFIKIKYVGFPTALIDIPPNALDLFKKDGYALYAQAYFMRTQGIVIRDEYKGDFYYIINYDAGAEIPKPVSVATAMMVQNFLTSVILASGTGTKQTIESADSIGSYESMSFSVNFNKSGMFSEKTGRIFSVTVRDILDRYVYMGQSW